MLPKILFSLFVISIILQICCCEGHQKLLGKLSPQGNAELKEEENVEEEIRKMLYELKAKLEHDQWIENPEQLVGTVLSSACEQFKIYDYKNKNEKYGEEVKLGEKMKKFCDEPDVKELSDIEEMIRQLHTLINRKGRKMVNKQKEKEKFEGIPMESAEVKNVDEIHKILGLIEAKMGQGSAKSVLKKALKRDNLMRPSGLMELVMDLWKVTTDMTDTNGGRQRDDQKQVGVVHHAVAPPHQNAPAMPLTIRVHRRRRRFDYKFSLDDGVLLLLAWIFVYCSVLLGDAFINLMDESYLFYGCVVFGVYVIFAMLRVGKLKW